MLGIAWRTTVQYEKMLVDQRSHQDILIKTHKQEFTRTNSELSTELSTLRTYMRDHITGKTRLILDAIGDPRRQRKGAILPW
jgi:hypothetical protein